MFNRAEPEWLSTRPAATPHRVPGDRLIAETLGWLDTYPGKPR